MRFLPPGSEATNTRLHPMNSHQPSSLWGICSYVLFVNAFEIWIIISHRLKHVKFFLQLSAQKVTSFKQMNYLCISSMWYTYSSVLNASIISLWVLYFFNSALLMVMATLYTLSPEFT